MLWLQNKHRMVNYCMFAIFFFFFGRGGGIPYTNTYERELSGVSQIRHYF